MGKGKRICILTGLLALALTLVYSWQAEETAPAAMEYVLRLFDSSYVHNVDLELEDFDRFLEEADREAYVPCRVTIDAETFSQVGLRVKGNNSRRLTSEYGLSRYSLKLEFDHYIRGGNYYGLDKLSLDASFQDNSYLKTWLAYDMMAFMNVPAPLCSFVWIRINGEPWGLYLAVEEPEDGFILRNGGDGSTRLYKPDYRSLRDANEDLALKYLGDDPDLYPNIFDNAKVPTSYRDRQRLIRALERLDKGEDIEQAVNVDQVLRYFTVQVFVMNWDSYIGQTGHNYFLWEQDGMLSMLPWDYNLAFGTYALGKTDPVKDPNVLINYPVNTPAQGSVMLNRPLYHKLMQYPEYLSRYHQYFDALLSDYFESGRFESRLDQIAGMIGCYVNEDPTAFCDYEDHVLAVQTLRQVCLLRAEAIRGQLSGDYPITLRQQQENPGIGVDASHIRLEDLGDFGDLKKE